MYGSMLSRPSLIDKTQRQLSTCSHCSSSFESASSSDIVRGGRHCHDNTLRGSVSGVKAMRWQVLVFIIATLVLYLLLGGIVFWSLEARYDEKQAAQLPPNRTPSVDARIQQLIEHIINGSETASGNPSICQSKTDLFNVIKNWTDAESAKARQQIQNQWNLPGSIFFAITVVTTIGYGNLVPRSTASRAFCCLYAIIGIPLCLVTIVNIGAQLDSAARWFERRIRRVNVTDDVITAQKQQQQGGWLRCRYARSILFALLGSIVFLFIPAALFYCLQDDWDYGTAVYFAIISLSTIGFGDYVAGINYDGPGSAVYRLLVGVWIFMGLAWLAGVLSSLQESFQSLLIRFDGCLLACFPSVTSSNKLEQGPLEETTVVGNTATAVSATDNATTVDCNYHSNDCYASKF